MRRSTAVVIVAVGILGGAWWLWSLNRRMPAELVGAWESAKARLEIGEDGSASYSPVPEKDWYRPQYQLLHLRAEPGKLFVDILDEEGNRGSEVLHQLSVGDGRMVISPPIVAEAPETWTRAQIKEGGKSVPNR